MMLSRIAATLCVVAATLAGGCALNASGPGQLYGSNTKDGVLSGASVSVGSKEFTEQLLLCEIAAQRLESQGATVKRICGMSGSSTVRAAEVSGDVDMYWEYTGTGWLTHLGEHDVITDPVKQYAAVRDTDARRNQIVWLEPAPANNSYAVGVAAKTANRLVVRTLSDYARLANTDPSAARFCGAAEFLGRDDGWAGLQQAYRFALPRDNVAELAEGPIYNSIHTGNPCTFGEVFPTDGRIKALNLTVLEDDRSFFPVYNVSLTVRKSVLAEYPAIAPIIAPVSALLDDPTVRWLNAQVDAEGKTLEEVAGQWLREHGLS